MRLSLGLIIAIVLIFVWWREDHPSMGAPLPTHHVFLDGNDVSRTFASIR